MAITKVWIEEGCIVCNACETTCPEVFNVTEDSCHIRAEVRVDGKIDTNLPAKSPLSGSLGTDGGGDRIGDNVGGVGRCDVVQSGNRRVGQGASGARN